MAVAVAEREAASQAPPRQRSAGARARRQVGAGQASRVAVPSCSAAGASSCDALFGVAAMAEQQTPAAQLLLAVLGATSVWEPAETAGHALVAFQWPKVRETPVVSATAA